MKITGELLKAERTKKNLSVQEVALSLKLSSKLVNAIEAGNLGDLPAKTFVRGFVKSYAQLLKLDADMVLRQFQEEMGSTSPLPKTPPPMPEEAENIKASRPAPKHTSQNYSGKSVQVSQKALQFDNSKKIVIFLSVAVALIIILVLSNKLIQSYKADPIATVAQENNAAAVSPAAAPPATDSTATTVDASVINPGSPETKVAATDEVRPLGAALPAPDNKAQPRPTDVQTAKNTVPPNTPGPEEGFQKSPGRPIELMIEAKKDHEVFYARGDNLQFTPLKLKANQVQVIRSKTGLYLKSSDGGAFKLIVNGQDMGVAGGNNKPVKFTF